MSPIDDELRAALHHRATVLPPSPDPLAGVERRAVRLRRRAGATSVAGTVLGVAAVALAVPALTPSDDPRTPRVAASTPASPAPTAPVVPAAYRLDPDDPWAYRGTPLVELGKGFAETVAVELAVRRGVPEEQVVLTPVFGQRDEPSQSAELVYVAQVAGERRWGVAATSEAGPELRVDEPLSEPALALAAALPGDEVPRLLVVAAPAAGALEYGPGPAGAFTALAPLADGVGTIALEGDPATDSFRVLAPDGRELLREPAPGPGAPPPAGDDGTACGAAGCG